MSFNRKWQTETLSRLLGAYMIALGAVFCLGGADAISSDTYYTFRRLESLGPFPIHYEVGSALILIGAAVLIRRLRSVALMLAVGAFFLITVAFTTATFKYPGASWTAPITYAFVTMLAAWLHSMTRAFR